MHIQRHSEVECMITTRARVEASEAPQTSSIRIIHAVVGTLLLMKVCTC